MGIESPPRRAPGAARERGQAMLLTVLLLGVGASAVVYNFVAPAKQSIERDKITAAALAQAKAALIGFAAGANLAAGASRPGDLPCPDRDDDGDADAVPACDTPALALGRLPWRTLGLPDLRDGHGERLWYAVSTNFKNNTRTACVNPGDPGCLNSDTRGTITLRRTDGAIMHDGTNPDPFTPSGVAAVIIAPGAVLQRQGAGAPQDRSPAGVNNAVNYLDVALGEDNAVFADNSADGFIAGPVFDAGRNEIVNDRILAVTYADLMPLLERRVVKEASNCLASYAAEPKNKSRYPWASSMANSAGASPYNDTGITRFGRIPDPPLLRTLLGSFFNLVITTGPPPLTHDIGALVQALCNATPALCMGSDWPAPPACHFASGSWWPNWKNQVFYGMAAAYTPIDVPILVVSFDPLAIPPLVLDIVAGGVPAPAAVCPPASASCLTVDPPSATADKRVVVMVSGKRLATVAGGQPRGSAVEKATPANYVEAENDWTTGPNPDRFLQQGATASFNDQLLHR